MVLESAQEFGRGLFSEQNLFSDPFCDFRVLETTTDNNRQQQTTIDDKAMYRPKWLGAARRLESVEESEETRDMLFDTRGWAGW
jgi:hypothetical protein